MDGRRLPSFDSGFLCGLYKTQTTVATVATVQPIHSIGCGSLDRAETACAGVQLTIH